MEDTTKPMNWKLEDWEELWDELRIHLPVEPTKPFKPYVFGNDLMKVLGITLEELILIFKAGKFGFGEEGSDWCIERNLCDAEVIVYPEIQNMRLSLTTAEQIAISVDMRKGRIIKSYLDTMECELSYDSEPYDLEEDEEDNKDDGGILAELLYTRYLIHFVPTNIRSTIARDFYKEFKIRGATGWDDSMLLIRDKSPINYINEFEIWGINHSGSVSGVPHHMGRACGKTFEDACREFAKTNTNFNLFYNSAKNELHQIPLFRSKEEADGYIMPPKFR